MPNLIINKHNLIVQGVWLEWAAWGACTAPCGGGVKIRDRTCDLSRGGFVCPGEPEELVRCNEEPCSGALEVKKNG